MRYLFLALALAACGQTQYYDRASGARSCVTYLGDRVAIIGTQTGDLTLHRLTAIEGRGLVPGRDVHARVAGRHFSGPEGILVTPELFAAMRDAPEMHVSWSPWPQGGTRQKTVSTAKAFEAMMCP